MAAAAPVNPNAPVLQLDNVQYSIPERVISLFDEKAKDVIRALGYTARWAVEAFPNLPSSVSTFGTFANDAKNLLNAVALPGQVYRVKNMVATHITEDKSTWSTGRVVESLGNIFKEACLGVNWAYDSLDLSQKFINLSDVFKNWTSVVETVKGVNSAATALGSAVDIGLQSKRMTEDGVQPVEMGYRMIRTATSVSYFAVGAIGLAAFAGFVMAPWVMLACLTAGLTGQISAFFYEKINDPESKGKNLKPDLFYREVVRAHGPVLV